MQQFSVQKLNETTGEICPKGAFVTCHYHGTLMDGTVFDSSVKKGRPFKFQAGIGQVIKAWDEGMTQLRKGEKAILICPPDYAYGSRGAGGVIPPNATLKFEVEMIDFQTPVQASHILLKHKGSRNPVVRHKGTTVTRTKQEAVDGINQIRAQIVNGEDFSQLALNHSECGSAQNGGDLGEFGPGQMQESFEKATYALQVGELSDIVDSDSGIHIILRTA